MRRHIVVVTEHLDDASTRWLADRADVVHADPCADAVEALDSAAGLVVRTYTRVDDALLGRAPRLRVVGRAGVGLDNIDVQACRARGIEVVHTPEANTQAVVEYAVAMLMREWVHVCESTDASRGLPVVAGGLDGEAWNALRAQTPLRRQCSDMTVGILGLGRIGRGVARALTALSVRVLYHDLEEIPEAARFGAESVPRDQLLAASHAISIHVDGRAGNRHLVDRAVLEEMRDDVILLNTSRGFVVDNSALSDFLDSRPEARAILDVHDPEPVPPGAPLLDRSQVTITPHVAARTASAQRAMGRVVEDVLAVLDGKPPRWPAPEAPA